MRGARLPGGCRLDQSPTSSACAILTRALLRALHRSTEASMIRFTAAIALGCVGATVAFAQNAPPTYQGDPDVYKVIFEDQNFRVIAATRKKGVHDKAHGHPLPSIVYNVTDCTTKLYALDGKTTENSAKAGTAGAVPVIASHSAENIGPTDCQQIFVERK